MVTVINPKVTSIKQKLSSILCQKVKQISHYTILNTFA